MRDSEDNSQVDIPTGRSALFHPDTRLREHWRVSFQERKGRCLRREPLKTSESGRPEPERASGVKTESEKTKREMCAGRNPAIRARLGVSDRERFLNEDDERRVVWMNKTARMMKTTYVLILPRHHCLMLSKLIFLIGNDVAQSDDTARAKILNYASSVRRPPVEADGVGVVGPGGEHSENVEPVERGLGGLRDGRGRQEGEGDRARSVRRTLRTQRRRNVESGRKQVRTKGREQARALI